MYYIPFEQIMLFLKKANISFYSLGTFILLTIIIAKNSITNNTRVADMEAEKNDKTAIVAPARVIGIPIKESFKFNTLKRAKR